MTDRALPTGTLTFVFTDIEGSTQLVRDLQASYGLALRIHHRILQACFEEQGGRTKLTVKASAKGFHPAAPQMLAGMDAGWSQSLEKLETLMVAMVK